jgi:hypothetical protein
MALTVIGISRWLVMKMIGIRIPASLSLRWTSSPLIPGSLMWRTTQQGASGILLSGTPAELQKLAMQVNRLQ